MRFLPACAAPRIRSRRRNLFRLRLLFFVFRLVGSACEAVRQSHDGTAGPYPAEPRHRGGQQRRLPAAALPGGGHPGTRRRARGERGRDCPGPGHPHRGPIPRPDDRPGDRRRPWPGRPGGREQRIRPRAGYPRLRGRAARAGQGRRHGDTGVPAPAPADRATAIRHHLPRALLLPVASHLVACAGHGRTAGRRRGRVVHPRRLAAGLCPPGGGGWGALRGGQGGAGGRGGCGPAHGRGSSGLRRRRAEDQERPARIPADGGPRGQVGGRLRRPGKGNTLLNHCGIRSDLLAYTVDRSPVKQGWFLPGTHIPIYAPERLAETKPDYVLVLPWNLREEISQQLAYVRSWGGKLVFPIPELEVT